MFLLGCYPNVSVIFVRLPKNTICHSAEYSSVPITSLFDFFPSSSISMLGNRKKPQKAASTVDAAASRSTAHAILPRQFSMNVQVCYDETAHFS